VEPDRVLSKGGLRPYDRIILTKPVGTGTLFAADMRHKAKGPWVQSAVTSMLQSNQQAARCLHRYCATACTDVTGFGLLGHLVEMVKPAGVDVNLDLSAIPVLPGASETNALGITSSLQPQNVRLRRAIRDLGKVRDHVHYPLLFDPQTAGGLLADVPADEAADCVAELRESGYPQTAIIGEVRPRGDQLEPVSVTV
jgi:selenide,water dikinase